MATTAGWDAGCCGSVGRGIPACMKLGRVWIGGSILHNEVIGKRTRKMKNVWGRSTLLQVDLVAG